MCRWVRISGAERATARAAPASRWSTPTDRHWTVRRSAAGARCCLSGARTLPQGLSCAFYAAGSYSLNVTACRTAGRATAAPRPRAGQLTGPCGSPSAWSAKTPAPTPYPGSRKAADVPATLASGYTHLVSVTMISWHPRQDPADEVRRRHRLRIVTAAEGPLLGRKHPLLPRRVRSRRRGLGAAGEPAPSGPGGAELPRLKVP
jgi:hypothetical protein